MILILSLVVVVSGSAYGYAPNNADQLQKPSTEYSPKLGLQKPSVGYVPKQEVKKPNAIPYYVPKPEPKNPNVDHGYEYDPKREVNQPKIISYIPKPEVNKPSVYIPHVPMPEFNKPNNDGYGYTPQPKINHPNTISYNVPKPDLIKKPNPDVNQPKTISYIPKPEFKKSNTEGYGYIPKSEQKESSTVLRVPKPEKPNTNGYEYAPKPAVQGKLFPSITGIQGLIYCKSGPKLIPVEGALARIKCLAVDKKGYESAPFSVLCHPTDAKGYFFATVSPHELEDGWELTECKAFLEKSPLETCNVPTDVNKGISGALLSSYRPIKHGNVQLYSVGPFFYTPEPKPTVSNNNGY